MLEVSREGPERVRRKRDGTSEYVYYMMPSDRWRVVSVDA